MARCARSDCGRWRPDALVRRGRLGVSFDEKWYCSTACLEAEAGALISEARHHDTWVPVPATPLGRLLLQRQAVSPEDVERALHTQRGSGRRLGAELIAMGATSPDQVLRALAAQAGVGCLAALDPSRVAAGPGGLPREMVRLLGVVPFEASERRQRLSVACAGPLPGGALAAVREITGWQIQPFLVPDDVLTALVDAYGTARAGVPAHPLRTVPDAAASIARAAQRGLARRMQQVRIDSLVWVRLEGETRPEDFMVTLDPPPEEHAWQAAPTPH
jgi:hypothetical protein